MMICIEQKTIDRLRQDIIPENTAKQKFLDRCRGPHPDCAISRRRMDELNGVRDVFLSNFTLIPLYDRKV
jgi:hypothetical protein